MGGRGQLPTNQPPALCDILNLHLAPNWTRVSWVGGVSGRKGRLSSESNTQVFQSPKSSEEKLWMNAAAPILQVSGFILLSCLPDSFSSLFTA